MMSNSNLQAGRKEPRRESPSHSRVPTVGRSGPTSLGFSFPVIIHIILLHSSSYTHRVLCCGGCVIAFPVFGFSVRFLKQWPNSSTRDFAKFPCVALSARLCRVFRHIHWCVSFSPKSSVVSVTKCNSWFSSAQIPTESWSILK